MVQESPSKYFNNYNYGPRQRLLEDLIISAIRMHGLIIKYLPREEVNTNRDNILGEDLHSKFTTAFEVEAYVKNVDNFEGEGDVLGKFGLEIKDQMTLTISRKRWGQSTSEKLVNENGVPYDDEDVATWQPSKLINYTLESPIKEGYDVDLAEPRAGDLIFFPMTQSIYEITFVERESLFYQHGVLLTYDLKVELFRYSSEQFETNDEAINELDDFLNLSLDDWTMRMEEGDELLLETGSNIVQEQTAREDVGDNTEFQHEGGDIVNFNDMSPLLNVKEW